MRGSLVSSHLARLAFVYLGAAMAACSSTNEGGGTGGTTGSAHGGTTSATGGNSAQGGALNQQGGASQGGSSSPQGGSNAQGGQQGGANAQGGSSANGGAGGASTGGAQNSAGGRGGSAGGAQAGNANRGGSSANGGAGGASAGSANGGNSNAGSANGGSSNAGSANGGSATGGSATGGSGTGGTLTQPSDPCAKRAGYRNLFAEVLSKSEADLDAKLAAGYQSLFHGDSNSTVYHESGTDEAYILDVNNNDVRSEGMSYGMMISVHLDKKTEFNRLWKWARTHMYQSSGATAGYFSWQANPSGQIIGQASAPDGEEYIAMALILASRKWGDGSGIFAYSTEAKNLLGALATKGDFNTGNHLVTFGPNGGSATYTDPSYVLPAFYQVWACFDSATKSFWTSAVSAGRTLLQKTTNPNTGLAPYLANFDGSPNSGGPNFNSDSWRVVGNIMMDHHLFGADPWQKTFAAKYAAFFKTQITLSPMPDEYTLSGGVVTTHADPAKALLAEHAMVGFGVPAADAQPFVQILWDMKIPTGPYRYYDGLVYMLTTLHVGGRFRID
jgi:oligosaccharide reducing-end xylanase